MYTLTHLFAMHGILDHKTWGQISSIHKLKYNGHVYAVTPPIHPTHTHTPDTVGITHRL